MADNTGIKNWKERFSEQSDLNPDQLDLGFIKDRNTIGGLRDECLIAEAAELRAALIEANKKVAHLTLQLDESNSTDEEEDSEDDDQQRADADAVFLKPLTPSKELAVIVGSTPLPRTEATKKIWTHIKNHSLQDPSNRRMINADDKLKPVFGGKTQVSMFEMTKMISDHLS